MKPLSLHYLRKFVSIFLTNISCGWTDFFRRYVNMNLGIPNQAKFRLLSGGDRPDVILRV